MEQQEPQLILCPYCGNAQSPSERCETCGGLFEPLSRKATQISMGPWYLRDKNQPFLPGCSYDILLRHIKAGRIKPTTIMRGPTTHQFWAIARNVPGIAHLLGYCHQCNGHVEPTAPRCPSCGAAFEAVRQRNELGLIYPDEKAVAVAQMRLEWEQAQRTGRFPNPIGPGGPGNVAAGAEARPASSGVEPPVASKGANPMATVGLDLLEEVLGTSASGTLGAGPSPTAPGSRLTSQTGPSLARAPAATPGRAGAGMEPNAPRSPASPMGASRSPLLNFGAEGGAATASNPTASAPSLVAGPARSTIAAPNVASGISETAPGMDFDGGRQRLTTTFWLLAGVTFLIILAVAVLVAFMLGRL